DDQVVLIIEADRAMSRQTQTASAAAAIELVLQRIRSLVAREFEVALQEIVLVKTGTFLRTSSGKIQRNASREAWLKGSLEVVHRWGAPRRGDSTAPIDAE